MIAKIVVENYTIRMSVGLPRSIMVAEQQSMWFPKSLMILWFVLWRVRQKHRVWDPTPEIEDSSIKNLIKWEIRKILIVEIIVENDTIRMSVRLPRRIMVARQQSMWFSKILMMLWFVHWRARQKHGVWDSCASFYAASSRELHDNYISGTLGDN